MRVSADQSDIGYQSDTARYIITLNGEKLWNVVTADEEAGYVVILVRGHDKFDRRQLTGKVVISCEVS